MPEQRARLSQPLGLKMINSKLFFCVFVIFIISVTGCDSINDEWHKYENREVEISGKKDARENILVTSDGWKLIAESEEKKGFYEWGWEVTVKVLPEKDKKEKLTRIMSINDIEYTLIDKDGFEIAKSHLNLNNYGIINWDDGGTSIVQDFNSTKTYRQTDFVPISKGKRAASSKIKIKVN
ncbi:MAG: hypothetical protein JXB25_08990 [Deltaproteobacteria bacterium]|nr:hypothetical protein [Deltaproteobacteria bacterium]